MRQVTNIMVAVMVISISACGTSSHVDVKTLVSRFEKAKTPEKISIIETLSDVEPVESDPAREALMEIVKPGGKNPDNKVRAAAALALAALDRKYPDLDTSSTKTAKQLFVAAAVEKDIETRTVFVIALSQLESEGLAAAGLFALSRHKDLSLAEMAVATLGNCRNKDARKCLKTIILVNPDQPIVAAAIVGLASQGTEAIDSLIEVIENAWPASGRDFVKGIALDQFEEVLQKSAPEESLKLLEHQNDNIRLIAGKVLRESGKPEKFR